MGAYIYSMKSKLFNAYCFMTKKKVQFCTASYTYKPRRCGWLDHDGSGERTTSRIMTMADKLVNRKDFKPDYMVMAYSGKPSGFVHPYKPIGNFYDDHNSFEQKGYLFQYKRRYYILPYEKGMNAFGNEKKFDYSKYIEQIESLETK